MTSAGGDATESAGESDRSAISVFLHGGVADAVVTDPQGRRLGRDPLSSRSYAEVPRGSSSLDGPIGNDEEDADGGGQTDDPPHREIMILRPVPGAYTLIVVGEKEGRYDLDVGTVAADASSGGNAGAAGVPTTRGAVHRYRFPFDPGPQPRTIALTRVP